jgi:SAM-dependent methyltransferase
MTQRGGPWQGAGQASWYAEFCDRFAMYGEVARALVGALEPSRAARVADLGSGTGVSATAALGVLGPAGRVVGVDPAARMVEAARARVADARARFCVGEAGDLAAMPEAPFDVATVGSAIWLCEPVEASLTALGRALRPGGRLGLSVPAEYLGHYEHLVSPQALSVSAALASLRGDTPPPSAAPAPPAGLGSLEGFTSLLAVAGFSSVAATVFSRISPAPEQRAWLGQPVVLAGLLGTDDPAALARARERLWAALPDGLAVEQRWLLITATRP